MVEKEEVLRKVVKDIESLKDMHWLISELQRLYTTKLVQAQIVHFFDNYRHIKKPKENIEEKFERML